MSIKIKTDTDNYVHAEGPFGDQTLCGLEQDGDEEHGICKGVQSIADIDCPQCLQLIRYCQTIRLSYTEELLDNTGGLG